MKHKKFIAMGILAIGMSGFVADKINNGLSVQDTDNLFRKVQITEQLPVQVTSDNKNIFSSSASANGTSKETINIGFMTTNVLKLLAPLENLMTNTHGTYQFIALHEFSHNQLAYLIKNKTPVFNLKSDSLEPSQLNLVNKKINNYIQNQDNTSLFNKTLHENFADTYAAVLTIRNLNEKYSDSQIKHIIKSRYEQVKAQGSLCGGALGDIEHRTDTSLEIVLNTPFSSLRTMTSKEAMNFSFEAMSTGTAKALEKVMSSMINNPKFQEDLTPDTISKLNKMYPAPPKEVVSLNKEEVLAKIASLSFYNNKKTQYKII